MAFDLMCVFPQETVNISSVRLLPGPVRAIEVVGADFRSVDRVLINSLVSPDVVILSKTRLLAQVPDGHGDRLLSVSVVSNKLTITPRSLLKFQIGDRPGRITGIGKLMQLFLKILFTTQGSDIFNKRTGGNALRNVGTTYSSDAGGEIVQDFIIAVDQTVKQIVAIQGRKQAIPRDERLLSAKVESSSFNKEAGGLDVTVRIVSQAGESALANLEV